MDKNNAHSTSLNKYISNTGICSRREANQYISEGRVLLNGKRAELGNRVFPGDKVSLDGHLIKNKNKTIYIVYNKPVGVVSTTDSQEKDNIIRHVNHPKRLFPIGRLDKPSEGLIFLTNDGDIVNKILRAGNRHEKEYVVRVKQAITNEFIRKMSNGIPILGTVTKKCKVSQINKYTFKIILVQGLNRQIRRMCEYLGYQVTQLKRTRIMNVTLGKLRSGQWRELTKKEIEQIQVMISGSTKTEEASIDRNKRKSAKTKTGRYKDKNRNRKKN